MKKKVSYNIQALHERLGKASDELLHEVIKVSGIANSEITFKDGLRQCLVCGHVHASDMCPKCGTQAEVQLTSKDFHGWWSGDKSQIQASGIVQKHVAVYDSMEAEGKTFLIERMFLVTNEHTRVTEDFSQRTSCRQEVTILEIYQNWEENGRRYVFSVPTKMFPNWCYSPFSRYCDQPMKRKHPIRDFYGYTHEWWDYRPERILQKVYDNPWNHYIDPNKF